MDARLAGWGSFVKCLRIEIFESRACSVTRATFDRLIAFSCVDLVLLFLAFLIDDRKRTSIEGYQLYCDLMKFTVFRAGWMPDWSEQYAGISFSNGRAVSWYLAFGRLASHPAISTAYSFLVLFLTCPAVSPSLGNADIEHVYPTSG